LWGRGSDGSVDEASVPYLNIGWGLTQRRRGAHHSTKQQIQADPNLKLLTDGGRSEAGASVEKPKNSPVQNLCNTLLFSHFTPGDLTEIEFELADYITVK